MRQGISFALEEYAFSHQTHVLYHWAWFSRYQWTQAHAPPIKQMWRLFSRKIIEKISPDAIVDHLMNNNLTSTHQHGFVKKKYMCNQLVQVDRYQGLIAIENGADGCDIFWLQKILWYRTTQASYLQNEIVWYQG